MCKPGCKAVKFPLFGTDPIERERRNLLKLNKAAESVPISSMIEIHSETGLEAGKHGLGLSLRTIKEAEEELKKWLVAKNKTRQLFCMWPILFMI